MCSSASPSIRLTASSSCCRGMPVSTWRFGAGGSRPSYSSMNASSHIPVDFANADEDGAVRLVTRATLEYCKDHGIVLSDGLRISMSDGELKAEAVVSQRGEFWV